MKVIYCESALQEEPVRERGEQDSDQEGLGLGKDVVSGKV